CRCYVFFFFFQAEDGIRDFHVTGVQTCALPISLRGTEISPLKKNDEIVERLAERILGRVSLHNVYDPETDEVLVNADELINEARSEERRVGKESRNW